MTEHKKVWLNEISFMRPILLVLLVSYHAFAPYCGAWEMPEGVYPIESYKWIALFSKAFRLEAFVFISGYIFTFQLLTKHKFNNVWELISNKIKRLLIPCVFFGCLYYLCFQNSASNYNPMSIITGIGHLWYLPCLFWLFIGQYAITRLAGSQISNSASTLTGGGILLILMLLPGLSLLPLPMQLNRALYYMLFFYGGGLFYQYSDKIAVKTSNKNTILLWCFFIILGFALNIFMENISVHANDGSLFTKMCLRELNIYLKICLAWIGIIALYQTAVLFCRKHTINKFLLHVGTCGYGVYVFHQFILVFIYDRTAIPQILGTYSLPWISLIITIIISVSLTLLIRKTKLGRIFL